MRRIIKRHKQGSVLLAVIWALMVLALMAWGLSRRSAMTVSVLETAQGKGRSYYAARAGVNYLADLLKADKPPSGDTFFQTAISYDDKNPKEIFHLDLGQGLSVDIFKTPLSGEISKKYYGVSDERGKINLAAVNNEANAAYLSALLASEGVEQDLADKISWGLVDYNDLDSNPLASSREGEGNVVVDGGAFLRKNAAIGFLEEMMLISGVTPRIIKAIRNDVTVYGDTRGININPNTASEHLLRVTAGVNRSLSASSADSLAGLAIAKRNGPDGVLFTPDDGEGNEPPNIPMAWDYHSENNFYAACVVGRDDRSGQQTTLRIVLEAKQGSRALIKEIMEW